MKKFLIRATCIIAMVLALASCDDIVESVLNYPGSVIIDKSYVEGKYKFELLMKTEWSNGPHYSYETITVRKYEFDRYDIGDTIPEQPKTSD